MSQLRLPIKPSLIAFEGIDGAGKTEIIKKLKRDCEKGLFRAVFTREPGGSIVGEKIRSLVLDDRDSEDESPLTRLLLYMASRASNVDKKIRPALEEGSLAITDRLDVSTFAFQLYGGECRELESVFLRLRQEILVDIPIVYIYLRITPDIAAVRRKCRPESAQNFLDRLPADFHQRVFCGYENFFGRFQRGEFQTEESDHHLEVVDASGSQEEVYAKVLPIVAQLWGSQTP